MSEMLPRSNATIEDRSSPRLLVSVRDAREAVIARDVGTDLIDLKEPSRGSLGKVDWQVIQDVASVCPQSTLSLALGELSDWDRMTEPPPIPQKFQYLKLGLAGERQHHNWTSRWHLLKQRMETTAGKSFNWIAVVYADYATANSPTPEQVIDAAVEQSCKGVLFDTFSKREGDLLTHLTLEQLAAYRETIGAAGLLTAWAGSLQPPRISSLLPLNPDIIGVRGAVCDDNNRTGVLRGERIKKLRDQLSESPLPTG